MIQENYCIDYNSIIKVEAYDYSGNLIGVLEKQNETLTHRIKSIKLARYLLNRGHELVDGLNLPAGSPFIFRNSQSLCNDIAEYEDMSKAIDAIKDKIDILLEVEKNYPEDIDDLNDYFGLICSINKLLKLKAIILANIMCEKDIMSFVKKEKYLYPVIECYSDTSRDVTGKMIKYYMKYAKKEIEHVGYDNAMFDYR